MKAILILLMLLPLTIIAQNVKGTYCNNLTNNGYCFTFTNDSIFEYSFRKKIIINWGKQTADSTADTGFEIIQKAKGIYKINDNQLILKFLNDTTQTNSFSIQETDCILNDSIEFQLSLMDKETNEPIPFAKISLTYYNNISSTTTDNLGKAIIKVKKQSREYELNISYVGYKFYKLNIKSDNCKDIKIMLFPVLNVFPVENGETWIYTMKKVEPDKLILQDKNIDIIITKK